MNKRGNMYLRRMLIHGARSVLFRVKYETGGFGQWVHRLAQRAPRNKVVVAIANKLARVAFPPLLRRSVNFVLTKSAEERRRRKNCPTTCQKT